MLQHISTFSPSKILEAINQLIDRANKFTIVGAGGLQVHRSGDRYTLGTENSRIGAMPQYMGMFRVFVEDSGNLRICDGMNSIQGSDSYAGFIYYNNELITCPSAAIAPKTGYLLIQCTEEKAISYVIEDTIPSMPINADGTTGTVAKFPLARIDVYSDGVAVNQILRYQIPIITVYGVCEDTDTAG